MRLLPYRSLDVLRNAHIHSVVTKSGCPSSIPLIESPVVASKQARSIVDAPRRVRNPCNVTWPPTSRRLGLRTVGLQSNTHPGGAMISPESTRPSVIARDALADLFRAIRERGYQIVGPTIREGAIVYAELKAADDLPVGWTDVQEPGSYRLERRADKAVFGFAVGPHSAKKYLLPP